MPQSQFTHSSGLLVRETATAVVLLPPDCTHPLILRETSAAVWRAFRRASTVARVTDCLRTEYQSPPPTMQDDIERLVGELVSCGALERV
jgi:hypothetical protein